ncbi:ShlB/FhaC/HecB family hemolysin secretion/activation protein [Neosynechococcus sphagnicola]|nr:ShlB/FhaC/HecB family hemolysin secretion/activation protein [Neosynechococcus sphagnicola]
MGVKVDRSKATEWCVMGVRFVTFGCIGAMPGVLVLATASWGAPCLISCQQLGLHPGSEALFPEGSGRSPGFEVAQRAAPPNLTPRPNPNLDRFLQPPPTPTPLPAPTPPLFTPPSSTPAPTEPTVPIPVTTIDVKGSTVFGAADWNPIIQPLQGHSVTLEQLQQVADAITQLYLNKGYITSRAILVDQTIVNGVVQIQVIEGRLESIQVQGNKRVSRNYISSRIRLGAKTPLNTSHLEDQLRLLKADPLFKSVEASLRPGKELGGSILVVKVAEANHYITSFFADNYSPPSVGGERFGVIMGHRNLSGQGDTISAAYNRTTTGGANVYDFDYALPVNAMNGTLLLRAAPYDNQITDPNFKQFGIRGTNSLYEIGFRQPLIRSTRQEFALSLGFAYQSGQTFLFDNLPTPFGIGPSSDGVSTTSIVKFGQDYVRRDALGAWALRSQVSVGTGLFDATQNPAPIPDGEFISWLGQAQRVQLFGKDRLLILSADLQLTPNSLLPQQQFVIGGGQSIRGYRQNVRSGDNGFRVSAEGRLPIYRDEAGKPLIQLAPFFDAGAVWNQVNNPNLLPEQTFVAGAGLGLLWEPFPRFNVRLDYGIPLIDLRDRGNNIQDAGFYFSVGYRPW